MIISKLQKRLPMLSFWLILLLAAFLRLWRIGEFTEFLGDQGRTGIHIYQAWTTKTLLLVGPTVLSGQHLGPAFYYLIAPFFILGGFDPIWPAVGTALFGTATVVLLWWLLKQWFDWRVASLVSLLYAVSPLIVSVDRTLWEPNLVPFFATLYALGVYTIRKHFLLSHSGRRAGIPDRFWVKLASLKLRRSGPGMTTQKMWEILLGITIGILVQLHYPNVIFFFLTGLFYGYLWLSKKLPLRLLLQSLGLVVVGCLLTLLPFLYYEATHNFENTIGVAQIILSSGSAPLGKRVWLWNVTDYSMRVFGRVFSVSHSLTAILLAIITLVAVIRRDFWLRFLTIWLFAGVGTMALYRGVVYDHYLYFLTPVPFLLLGHLLFLVRKKISIFILAGFVGLLAFAQSVKLDTRGEGAMDIPRTKEAVNKITELAAGEPFSFTLVQSRSFSDLHYRYFFETAGIKPHPITSNEYQLLFLVCETGECSNAETIIKQRFVSVLCYEDHCRGLYPEIDLNKWKLAETVSLADSILYQLVRVNN